jgi:DeoR family deoxyribose operon repressor
MLAQNIDDQLDATILCYNANILNSLRSKENLSLIFAGGKFHPKTQMVESAEGNALISSMRFTKAFISAAGIHHNLGVTCAYHYEIATKKAIMQSSVQKILLMDSSKFDQVKPAYFADITDFDMIITDASIPKDWKDEIESMNITLHVID